MTVQIQLKQIKKRGGHVAACPLELNPVPETLRQLLTLLVTDGVQGYNARIAGKPERAVLSEDAMAAMEQIGKIGFGIPYGTREADLDAAIASALQGFSDGLFRVFIGDREAEALDEPLDLQENDTITIIRLVMLTGGYF